MSTTQEALAIVETHPGPALIDLDETLYLRNSTEDYIDSAVPALAALLLMRCLDVLRPWRWSGGLATRDVWRVGVLTVLLPWTRWLWRRRVRRLAAQFVNRPLHAALLRRSGENIIVTVGFRAIVRPLLAAMGLGGLRLVAARTFCFADRARGKHAMAEKELGAGLLAGAAVLTDSVDDAPLLERCATPLRVVWPDARYVPALSRVYLPGQYISRVKRPGQRYILRGIIQEDLALWLLASIALASNPWTHVAGLCLLLVSFWAVYERGYVDNDEIAARFEVDPALPAASPASVVTPRWRPWIWAALSGLAALAVLRQQPLPAGPDIARWAGVLAAVAVIYYFYNRFDKPTRVWLFALLQLLRAAAFVVVVPVSVVGAAALAAHVLARWVPYEDYRYGSGRWNNGMASLRRLLFFCVFCAVLAAALGPHGLWDRAAPFLAAYLLFRARSELVGVVRAAHRIDRGGSSRRPKA